MPVSWPQKQSAINRPVSHIHYWETGVQLSCADSVCVIRLLLDPVTGVTGCPVTCCCHCSLPRLRDHVIIIIRTTREQLPEQRTFQIPRFKIAMAWVSIWLVWPSKPFPWHNPHLCHLWVLTVDVDKRWCLGPALWGPGCPDLIPCVTHRESQVVNIFNYTK